MWARHKPRKQWADIGLKWLGQSRPRIFLGPGWTKPRNLGWANTGLAQSQCKLFAEREQWFTFCIQPKWLQKMEIGGGAAHSKQESRS
jgi:hypothetical protein